MHLPLIGRRSEPLTSPAPPETATTARLTLLAVLRVREGAALDQLGRAAGDQSLCALSRSGMAAPAAKYHEGSAAALAEARRAVQRAGDSPDGAGALAEVIRDIRGRWLAQVGSAGRTGPDWSGYLTGGLDALEQIDQLLDDENGGVRDLPN
ncbi:hypothetical protein [Pengzhenrongella phosphoraccumulans]|uniref:hypothetical protein n=1 Tax=Pengzhenrongella phosphoraccumulans TaxID=3114394 RepID=UPI003890A948